MRDFKRELNTVVNSKEFPHYITPTLGDGNFDVAIFHFGVNDLLQNRSRSKAAMNYSLN